MSPVAALKNFGKLLPVSALFLTYGIIANAGLLALKDASMLTCSVPFVKAVGNLLIASNLHIGALVPGIYGLVAFPLYYLIGRASIICLSISGKDKRLLASYVLAAVGSLMWGARFCLELSWIRIDNPAVVLNLVNLACISGMIHAVFIIRKAQAQHAPALLEETQHLELATA